MVRGGADAHSAVRLSYAATIETPVRRSLCLALEAATGRRKLDRIYRRYLEEGPRTNFFAEAVSRMGIDLDVGGIPDIPATGPLVVVANHPFGAMDGIAIGALLGRYRDDVRIIAHTALATVPELAPLLFPIDFSRTREAERQNIRSRAGALAHLKAGGCIVVFPAGAVMTAPGAFSKDVRELPWGPLSARMILRTNATILPIHVPGCNSRLFQMASKLSQSVRYALLFHEAARMIGRSISLDIGAPITPAAYESRRDAVAMTAWLRTIVFALGRDRLPVGGPRIEAA